jgi:hypothetical protein
MNNYKYQSFVLRLSTTLMIILTNFWTLAKAQSLTEESNFFTQPPTLVNLTATEIDVWSLGSKYYFTIAIPENAGTSLEKVVISQRRGVEDIRYQLEKTFAFVGTPNNRGESLKVEATGATNNTAPITINFVEPIPPGKTFTIGLIPKINPGFGDSYLFGVTVFPVGENSPGLYLGVGRINFTQENPLRFPGR